ncbi:MAG: M3 family metallopeptidase [Verrucomicrobiales bacterium]|nr:M3 family metallopeptidase [Verrucomicrobiales bacterium]
MSTDSAPFLDTSYHIKWSQLVPEAVVPDLTEALKRAQADIDALAENWKAEELTFENTIEAFEVAGELMEKAWGKVSHLDSVRNSEALRDAKNKMLPEVVQFSSRVYFNDGLWERIKTYAESEEGKALTGIRRRLVDKIMESFIDSGANLPAETKKRLEEVQSELAQKTQKFSENVLDSTNAWDLVLEDDSRLGGIPETAKQIFVTQAKEKDLGSDENPVYRLTLQFPSMMPVLTYADDATLRKEVWEASTSVGNGGDFDNTQLIADILKLRQEKATLLGKNHYADQVLQRRMAKSGATALNFVDDLTEKTRPFFKKEIEQLHEFRKQKDPEWNGTFEPWDVSYWSEKLRVENFDFDDEALRPYFPINKVLEGMFRLTENIFGFKIEEKDSVYAKPGETPASDGVEVWHPEVKFYELRDEETNELLGSFYADWHPREEKRGGAWMGEFETGTPAQNGKEREPHLGLITGNLTPSSGNKPALLTHDEVQTVFHEFGHLLHHLLGDVAIKSLNGVNVVWDFVELPSQIMENFCWSRVSLDFFARHYETNEPIPEVLFDKMIAAKNFQSAMTMMRQLAFSKMDLELHINHHSDDFTDLDGLIEKILDGYLMPLATKPPTMARRFSHIFSGGYAAAYYSYKWAEVLDADAFTKFEAAGVLSPEVGRDFRSKILSQGNSREASELFEEFMGRGPELNSLLVRSGLAGA